VIAMRRSPVAVLLPLLLGAPVAVAAAPADPTPRAATELAPAVRLVPGAFVPGRQPDGNSVLIAAPDGLIVIDTGRHPEHAQAILAAAAAWGRPIAAVVNTHWHLDHIGGNPRLRAAHPGLQVTASGAYEKARTGFLTRYRAQLEQLIAETPDPARQAPYRAELSLLDAGAALGPDAVVRAGGERTIAGRRLRIGLEGPAVTAGDVWVYDPGSRILVAGDLVTLPVPLLDTACPAGWADALGRLAAVDFQSLVPGHGAPLDRAGFARYRTAFGRLLECAAGKAADAACIEGWLRDAGTLVPASEQAFARSLLEYYVPLLRDPEPLRARCTGS
jgi:glyoxylase-like metal-dependent hydrolase (beta-lactamase superfamily II)